MLFGKDKMIVAEPANENEESFDEFNEYEIGSHVLVNDVQGSKVDHLGVITSINESAQTYSVFVYDFASTIVKPVSEVK